MPDQPDTSAPLRDGPRAWVVRQFRRFEDIVYVGLALLLAGCATALLVASAFDFVSSLLSGTLASHVVDILDRILLVLMVVEILYTVQVSFREHVLTPEPFLIVGLIAGTRRILVLTAEFRGFTEKGAETFRMAMAELGLLGLLVVALVVAIVLLQRRRTTADRSSGDGSG